MGQLWILDTNEWSKPDVESLGVLGEGIPLQRDAFFVDIQSDVLMIRLHELFPLEARTAAAIFFTQPECLGDSEHITNYETTTNNRTTMRLPEECCEVG